MVTNKDRLRSWLKIYFRGSALQADTLLVAHDEAAAFRWAVITARYGKKSVSPLSVNANTGNSRLAPCGDGGAKIF